MRTKNFSAALGVTAVTLTLLTGCSAAPSDDWAPRGSSLDTVEEQGVDTERTAALERYVEAERAQLPQVMELTSGLYSNIEVTGRLQHSDGTRGLPVGTHAVVQFDYTYASPMDWPTTISALDAQKPLFEDACASMVFPAMREAGVTSPMGVVYTYQDVNGGLAPMWQYTCTE